MSKDKDLASAMKSVIKRKREEAHAFALCYDSDPPALAVSERTKAEADSNLKDQAKKKTGGKKVACGRVFGEDGIPVFDFGDESISSPKKKIQEAAAWQLEKSQYKCKIYIGGLEDDGNTGSGGNSKKSSEKMVSLEGDSKKPRKGFVDLESDDDEITIKPSKQESKQQAKVDQDRVDFERRLKKSKAQWNQLDKAVLTLAQLDADLVDKEGLSDKTTFSRLEIAGRCREYYDVITNAEQSGANNPTAGYKQLDGLREKLETWTKSAHKLTEKYIAISKVSIPMPDNWTGPPIKLHPSSLPGLEKLSIEERETLCAKVGAKIVEGRKIVQDLLNSNKKVDSSPEAVANVAWYLRTASEAKLGESWIKGSLTVPDPDHRLRDFFDQCGASYARKSSHMPEQQEREGGVARGIDFYKGSVKEPELMLPYGMQTLLVQSVTPSSGEDRLYVKMETEGARLSSGVARKDREDEDLKGFKDRSKNKADTARTLAHGANYAVALLASHSDMGMKSTRENVPKSILQGYGSIIESAKENGLESQFLECLLKGSYQTELNVIFKNLTAADELMNNNTTPVLVDKKTAALIAMLNDEIANQFGSEIQELQSRFGEEVLMTSKDLF